MNSYLPEGASKSKTDIQQHNVPWNPNFFPLSISMNHWIPTYPKQNQNIQQQMKSLINLGSNPSIATPCTCPSRCSWNYSSALISPLKDTSGITFIELAKVHSWPQGQICKNRYEAPQCCQRTTTNLPFSDSFLKCSNSYSSWATGPVCQNAITIMNCCSFHGTQPWNNP